MKLKYFIAGLLLSTGFFSNTLKAQGNNNTLSLAPAYWVQGGGVSNLPSFPSNVNDTYHGEIPEANHASIQDENGDLLFFVVDGRIYDSEGYMIEEMWTGLPYAGLLGQGKALGNSEVLIVPNPFDCKQYYLFSAVHYGTGLSFEPVFCILDLSLNNSYHPGRLGALVELQNNNFFMPFEDITPGYSDIVFSTPVNRGLIDMYYAAPKQQKCNDNQLVFLSHLNGILIYEITPSGIAFTNHLSYQFNNITGSAATSAQRGEMEVIEIEEGNLRVAAPFQYDETTSNVVGTAIYYADLTSEGQLIAGTEGHLLFPAPGAMIRPYINGLEFSPSGNILYINHNITDEYNWGNKYYDFVNATNGPVNLMIGLGQSFVKSQIETDLEGRLVMVKENGIAVLSDPDNPNVANWDLNFLNFTNFTYQSTGTSALWNTANNGGEESFTISKQIKQRSYSDYLFIGGCADGLSNALTYSGTWSPGLGSNPFGSISGVVYIDFTLVIPPGANLNIQNMEFRFTPGSRVIVSRGNGTQAGARLTLNNTVLTVDDSCDEEAMWHGVEVHGSPNLNQTPLSNSQQGIFRMFNNSGIEHSYLGAVTATYATESVYPFRPTNGNFSYTGGVIQATNSYFKNNRFDIQYHPYTAPNGILNQGFVRNCDLYTDGLLNDPLVFPLAHILIINVDGIRTNGIRVRNETPDLYAFNEQGSGIVSFNARYFVDPRCLSLGLPCTSFDKSRFENLYFGVYALAWNSMRTFRVDQTEFINNYYGIYAGGIDAARITRNEFEVYRSAAPNETFQTYGVFLNGCDGFSVEENFFTEFDDPIVSVNGETYGVIVQNSGLNDNRIYKNEFTNLFVGGQSQQINGRLSENITPLLISGLEFKCNRFFGDIFEADLALTSGRMRYDQGNCFDLSGTANTNAPAGNLFSYSTFTSQNDFAINPVNLVDQNVRYFGHADLPSDVPVQPQLFNTDRLIYTSCVNPSNPLLYDFENSCPSRIRDVGVIGVISILPDLVTGITTLGGMLEQEVNKVDGGNTEALLTLIQNGKNGEIRAGLLNASPYLSDEVLMAYLASNPPNGHVNQIIQANSPVSPAIMEMLNQMNLPNGIQQQMNQAQVGVSEMSVLFDGINRIQQERTLLLNETIQLILHDTIMVSPLDTIAKLLENEPDRRRREQLCDTYICQNDNGAYNQEREALMQAYGLDNFLRMSDISVELHNNGYLSNDTLALDPNMHSEVDMIANDPVERRVAVRAEAILDLMLNIRNLPIIEPIEWDAIGGKSMIALNEDESIAGEGYIKLYPNPTQLDEVALSFVGDIPENPVVSIYSLTGIEMKRAEYHTAEQILVNVQELNKGLYIVVVSSNDVILDKVKLIVN